MEEYMKTLLEQIRCKSARKLVEKEIREHILEQYEENLDEGMEEILAMEEAVKDMGSPVETGIALDAIHRPQMSWSMLIIIGVISFFSILIQVLVGNGNPMLGNGHILKHGIHVVLGFAMMLLVYRLDYSKIGRYAKRITGIACTVLFAAIYLGITASVNGAQAWFPTPFAPLSIPALLLFAVPLYGGILYSYYGTGYTGLFKSILWMIPPIWVAFLVPKIGLAVTLLFFQGILLSVALWKNWFQVKKILGLRRILGQHSDFSGNPGDVWKKIWMDCTVSDGKAGSLSGTGRIRHFFYVLFFKRWLQRVPAMGCSRNRKSPDGNRAELF